MWADLEPESRRAAILTLAFVLGLAAGLWAVNALTAGPPAHMESSWNNLASRR